MSFISYAQNFEDVMLWRALKHIQMGFYIDVGANDPDIDSVTKAFYERGWRGVNIEPLPSHHAHLIKARPRDISLLCAAGSTRGEIQLWECDVRGWATASADVVSMHLANGHNGTYHQVPIFPLREICAQYATDDIHFLKIDVEGFEKSVIDGMDFARFRPWILVIESTRPNSTEEIHWQWEPAVLSANYVLAYFDGLNRFYVAQEHSELLETLRYPPNIFDGFIRSEQLNYSLMAQQAEARVQQAEARVQQAEARVQQNEVASNHYLMQLHSVYASRSWKITGPLRWLGSRVSALRNRLLTIPATSKRVRLIRKSSNRLYLALDMYVLGQDVKTGVYRVCDELFRRLSKRREFDVRYLLRSNTQAASRNYLQAHDMHQEVVSENEAQPTRVCDMLLSPFGVAPGPWLEDPGMLQAHIIYDLIAIRRPDLFTQEATSEVRRIMDSLTSNTLVFAISEFTRQDLLDYRPDLSPDQVVVIPLAAGEQFAPCIYPEMIEAAKQRYSIPAGARYVLSLATLEVRKNLNRVVDAFVSHMNDYPDSDLYLVLAGMSGWKLESLSQSLSNAGRWRDRIVLTGFVEDCDLSAIYSGATCFIYLSQYEGFGLPPLEAMACGTPVICANNSSLPAVVGDAGLLVDANDVQAAAESIRRICSSMQLHSDLSSKGLERAKLFTWDKCEDIVTESLMRFAASKNAKTRPAAYGAGSKSSNRPLP